MRVSAGDFYHSIEVFHGRKVSGNMEPEESGHFHSGFYLLPKFIGSLFKNFKVALICITH